MCRRVNRRPLAYATYMPVMLAVIEIPGCLVVLFLASRLCRKGMDTQGNMAGRRVTMRPLRSERMELKSS